MTAVAASDQDFIVPAQGTDTSESFEDSEHSENSEYSDHSNHEVPNRPRYDLDLPQMPEGGWKGWAGPLAATALAAALRLPRLGTPHALVFDETYYAKDALSLLKFGYERKVIDGANDVLLSGNADIFMPGPSYVVHPPLGKWVIALGEQLFGATPFGWRIAVAILGILSVLITARIARRLTRSNVIGTTAGLLVALDGLHIAMSRTALLDTPLSFFVLCAFGFLIIDRDRNRTRALHAHAPRAARVAMVLFLGCAISTKWSGVYFALAFGVLMLMWDFDNRRSRQTSAIVSTWFRKDILPALTMPIWALAIYLTSWIGWFHSTNAWSRKWKMAGDAHPDWMSSLAGLLHYHRDMLHFHTHLTSPHSYKANPLGWPLMIRPTSFFYETEPTCGALRCSQEIIPLGNPVTWWGGAIALVVLAYFAFQRRHSAAAPIVFAFLAGWLPWVWFINRTTFTFYSMVFFPYTAMAAALMLFHVTRSRRHPEQDVWNRKLIGVLGVVAILAIFFYPINVGVSIPYDMWHIRMWLPGWV